MIISAQKRLGRVPLLLGSAALALFSLFTISAIPTHGQKAPPARSAKQTKPFFKLAVRSTPLIVLSLKAKDAKLSEIAADLEKRLQATVVVSQSLQQQTVTVEFEDLTLEPGVQLLAPHVYIDYEVGNQEHRPKAIFLSGYDDPQPSATAVINGSSQALLIEGDTEEGVESEANEGDERPEQRPRVSFANNKLTIKAAKQSVVLLVLKIGEELGIPVEIRHETPEVITLEINGVPVEEAVQRVSPNLRFYVRADLQRQERRPLRLVLLAPDGPTADGSSEPKQN